MQKYKLPYIGQAVDTVVLANGDFPIADLPVYMLQNADYVVCCDGAINSLAKTNIQPAAIVGDCDSLTSDNIDRFGHIVHRISEQETNDLTKAVQFCISQGRKKITILGATGKREDHTIGNISLLCEYLHQADVDLITDHGVFTAIDETAIFESFEGQQVSLFCIDRCSITTENLRYEVKERVFTNWWQATLNESLSEEFIIHAKGRILVYRAFL